MTVNEDKTVLVPLAQSCEELEAVTIIDLLVRAGIKVVTASLNDNKIITASRGVQLLAQTTLAEVKEEVFDMIVLPGGLPGSDYLNQDLVLRALLQKTVNAGRPVAAICAAPKVLVSAGLLDGKMATAFPGVLDTHPAKDMTYSTDAIVEDGLVVTAKSAGAAMDFALILVERLKGRDVRLMVEKNLHRN